MARRRTMWWTATLSSVTLALFSYRYLFSARWLSPEVLANPHAPVWLGLHVAGSATALLLGTLQLLAGLRRWSPAAHRRIGRIYMTGCLAGGIGGLPLAFGSISGPWVTLGFGTLSIVWLLTTGLAWRAAILGDVAAHRRWALRSWSLTFAAVTFRLYLPIFPLLGLPFVDGYRAASIYSWIVNLAIAEYALRRRAPGARRRPLALVRA